MSRIPSASHWACQASGSRRPSTRAPTTAGLSIVGVYPNPLAGEGTVQLLLTRTSDVRLGLFDVQGRERRRFVEDYQCAPGAHWLSIDATGLESGVYYLRASPSIPGAARRIVVLR